MKPWRKEGPLVADNGRGSLEVRTAEAVREEATKQDI